MRDAMLRPPNWLLPKTIGVEPPSLATEITNHPALIAFLDTQVSISHFHIPPTDCP
jgi:hypothetical protein|tara:strand:- start:352 stop:519 length:168 start_codon:yes stop_codon:yes gene_type:complete